MYMHTNWIFSAFVVPFNKMGVCALYLFPLRLYLPYIGATEEEAARHTE